MQYTKWDKDDTKHNPQFSGLVYILSLENKRQKMPSNIIILRYRVEIFLI